MMIHHVIPKHEWKKRFGNLVGINATDNQVNLTTEQHVQVHLLLYELNGHLYDKIAYLGLSKQIGREEAQRQASSIANKGRQSGLGKKFALGYKHTEEVKRRISDSLKGKKFSAIYKQRLSNALIGRPKVRVTCPHCEYQSDAANMKRWHLSKCKGAPNGNQN